MRSLKGEYDPEEGSNTTDDLIFTPEPSEAGGPFDNDFDNRAASADQPLMCSTSSEATLGPPHPEFELEKRNLTKPWNETNPWPGNRYMIIEKKTGRAITLQNGELFLPALDHEGQEAAQTAHNTWLCCEQNNYWGFQNTATGRYMGHDGGGGMRVAANIIQNWEMMVARPLPDGGYQLLMPHYWHTLQVVAIGGDGRHLTRRMHGGAVWEFRMVQT
ncbi:hypothetical protein RB595_003273 [Gaeumannomyces hyphopodioides]